MLMFTLNFRVFLAFLVVKEVNIDDLFADGQPPEAARPPAPAGGGRCRGPRLVTAAVSSLCRLRGTAFVKNIILLEKGKIFGRRNVVESFRFHPTLIVLFLKQIEFYYKF